MIVRSTWYTSCLHRTTRSEHCHGKLSVRMGGRTGADDWVGDSESEEESESGRSVLRLAMRGCGNTNGSAGRGGLGGGFDRGDAGGNCAWGWDSAFLWNGCNGRGRWKDTLGWPLRSLPFSGAWTCASPEEIEDVDHLELLLFDVVDNVRCKEDASDEPLEILEAFLRAALYCACRRSKSALN